MRLSLLFKMNVAFMLQTRRVRGIRTKRITSMEFSETLVSKATGSCLDTEITFTLNPVIQIHISDITDSVKPEALSSECGRLAP